MKNESNVLAQKDKETTEEFALNIWDFIQWRQEQISPSGMKVYHQIDGVIIIECDNVLFTTLRHISYDKTLLEKVSALAGQSDMKGKMFLYSSKGFLNVLDLKFSYA